jgi:hypothetical protein
MNIRGSASNLAQAMKDLMMKWEQTRESWRDAKSEEFHAHYLEHLPGHIARAMAAMEELDGLLRKVRKDCE